MDHVFAVKPTEIVVNDNAMKSNLNFESNSPIRII